ncbi:MAG: hypothetical protein ACK55I_49595, partial [bacterium]
MTQPLDGHIHLAEFVTRQKHLARGALAQAGDHTVLADVAGQFFGRAGHEGPWADGAEAPADCAATAGAADSLRGCTGGGGFSAAGEAPAPSAAAWALLPHPPARRAPRRVRERRLRCSRLARGGAGRGAGLL